MADVIPAAIPPARRSPLPRLILAVAVLGGAVWGVRSWLHGRAHVETDNAQVDGHITLVAPKVQAFVARVLVDDNVRVNAGDTLVLLDDRDMRVRLAQADADLATARAAVSGTRGGGQLGAQLQATEAQAGGAAATVRMARAMLTKADADLARLRGLAERKVIAAQQLDAAVAARDAADAQLSAAERQASAAASSVQAGGAAITAGRARVVAAEAAVAAARLNLEYTVLRSPVAGTIARRAVEPGALVQPGQLLMSVVPDSAIWVTANLKETELAQVRVGQSVQLRVDAYPGAAFEGRVASLSPATGARFALLPPDNATGNFTKVVQRVPVRITVTTVDTTRPLRPGMSVVAEIRVR